jgi:N-acetylglutamate synthase-like GNAT family acetyltransferase
VQVKFRKATLDDLFFLFELRKQTMDFHLRNAGLIYNDNHHRERIFDHFNDSLIIHVNEQAIGLLKLAVTKDKIHIRQLQIQPAFQNKGIGAKVLKLVQQRALKTHLPVTLNVLKKNPALALYKRAGFEIVEKNDIEYAMCCSVSNISKQLSVQAS